MRIDPKMRYGIELLSRIQRRAASGVVEWAVDRAFKEESVRTRFESMSVDQALTMLWHPNEIERLIQLATLCPDLLTFEETRQWNVVRYTDAFWNSDDRSGLDDFLLADVLDQWDVIEPLIKAASERPVVKGLSKQELQAGGVKVEALGIPF